MAVIVELVGAVAAAAAAVACFVYQAFGPAIRLGVEQRRRLREGGPADPERRRVLAEAWAELAASLAAQALPCEVPVWAQVEVLKGAVERAKTMRALGEELRAAGEDGERRAVLIASMGALRASLVAAPVPVRPDPGVPERVSRAERRRLRAERRVDADVAGERARLRGIPISPRPPRLPGSSAAKAVGHCFRCGEAHYVEAAWNPSGLCHGCASRRVEAVPGNGLGF